MVWLVLGIKKTLCLGLEKSFGLKYLFFVATNRVITTTLLNITTINSTFRCGCDIV